MGRNDPRGRVAEGEEFPVASPSSSGSITHHAGGAVITTEWTSEPVTREDTVKAMGVLAQARWHWPYLSQTLSTAKNGRETGLFIAGQVLARAMTGEIGMRVEVMEEHLAGVAAVLVASGITVSLFSWPDVEEGQPKRVAIDVWVDGE